MAKEPLAIWQHVVALLQDTKTKLTNMIQSEARAREDMDTLIDERLDGVIDQVESIDLSGLATKSEVANADTLLQGQLDDTYSAGVNLIVGSRNFTIGSTVANLPSRTYWSDGFNFATGFTKYIDEEGFTVAHAERSGASSAIRIIFPVIEAIPSEAYTTSFEIMVDDYSVLDGKTVLSLVPYTEAGVQSSAKDVSINQLIDGNIESGKWYKVSITQVLPPDTKWYVPSFVLAKNGSINFRKPMVQRGEVHNPAWSPNPFDYYMEDHVTGINLFCGTRDFTLGTKSAFKLNTSSSGQQVYKDGFSMSNVARTSFEVDEEGYGVAVLSASDVASTTYTYLYCSEIPVVGKGEYITVSCEVMFDNVFDMTNNVIHAIYIDSSKSSTVTLDQVFAAVPADAVPGEWCKVVGVLAPTAEHDENTRGTMQLQLKGNGTVKYRKVKAERGNIKQPIWSPSPFDNLQLADLPEASADQAGIVTTGTQTIAGQKNFTSTTIFSKKQDLDGLKDNRPAVIIGGTPTTAHMELDENEIHTKATATTTAPMYLNWQGGVVHVGDSIATKGHLILGNTFDGVEKNAGIYFYSTTRYGTTRNPAIMFIPKSSTATGIKIGDGGRTIIASGEAGDNFIDTDDPNMETEELDLMSDVGIKFYTNCNDISKKVETKIDGTGSFFAGYHMVLNQYRKLCTYDRQGTLIPLIHDNGSNIWIGANATAGYHHCSGLILSAGYNENNGTGNETVQISVPNDTNDNAKNYNVLHSGNWDKYITLENPIVPHTVIALVNFSAGAGIKLGESYSQYYTSTFKLSDLADSAKKGDVDALPGGTSSVNKAYVSVDAHVNNDSIYVANAFVDAVGNFFDSSPIKFTLMPYPGVSFANTAFSVTFKITWFG